MANPPEGKAARAKNVVENAPRHATKERERATKKGRSPYVSVCRCSCSRALFAHDSITIRLFTESAYEAPCYHVQKHIFNECRTDVYFIGLFPHDKTIRPSRSVDL